MKKYIIFLMIIIIPLNVKALVASSYIVMDTDSKRVLEGDNIYKSALIASTTKIMTAIVAINNGNLDKIVTINPNVLKSYGSGIYIEVGEKISINNLLYGLLLRSGNDAAIALADEVGGSLEGFVMLMNDLALSLGMENTKFVNPHGLEYLGVGNKSTVYDMALLSTYAIHNDIYKSITSTKKITVKSNIKTYVWYNKNKLLNTYEYCVGGKTGFTELARRTLVTNASKDNMNLTVVTFNDGNDFNDHKNLYEKYFNNYSSYQLVDKGTINTKYDNTYINESFRMILNKKEKKKIKINTYYYDEGATNIIGYLTVSLNDKEYFKTNIFQQTEKEEKKSGFWTRLIKKIGDIWSI